MRLSSQEVVEVGFELSKQVKLGTIDYETLKTFLSPLFFSVLDFYPMLFNSS